MLRLLSASGREMVQRVQQRGRPVAAERTSSRQAREMLQMSHVVQQRVVLPSRCLLLVLLLLLGWSLDRAPARCQKARHAQSAVFNSNQLRQIHSHASTAHIRVEGILPRDPQVSRSHCYSCCQLLRSLLCCSARAARTARVCFRSCGSPAPALLLLLSSPGAGSSA